MTLVLNVPLVLLSYKAVGKKFLLKTAVTMLISTFFLDIVFPFFPLYRGQRLLAAVYSGVLLGGGMVLFYLRGSSSGGIDFLTMAIKKKHPSFSLGKITLMIDLAVILLGWPRDDEYSQPFQNVQWSVRTGTVSSIDHVDHQYCSVGVSCEKNWNYRSDFGNCNIQTADSDMV